MNKHLNPALESVFATEIKKFRDRKKFTQEELAREWGVSRWAVVQYEAGKILPGISRIVSFHRKFGIDCSNWVTQSFQFDQEMKIKRSQSKLSILPVGQKPINDKDAA